MNILNWANYIFHPHSFVHLFFSASFMLHRMTLGIFVHHVIRTTAKEFINLAWMTTWAEAVNIVMNIREQKQDESVFAVYSWWMDKFSYPKKWVECVRWLEEGIKSLVYGSTILDTREARQERQHVSESVKKNEGKKKRWCGFEKRRVSEWRAYYFSNSEFSKGKLNET